MEVRRRFARWKVDLPAKIKLAGAEKFVSCHIDDISMMGVKISLPLRLPEDKFIKLTLLVSETFVLNIEAWVGWHKSAEGVNVYGLYFTRITEADKEKIYRYIEATHRKDIDKFWWEDDQDEENKKEAQDKRVFQRFAVRFPVRLLNITSGSEAVAFTQDISAKGVGLRTHEALQSHMPVEIWLEVPDKGEPIYTRGEVIWVKAEGQDDYRVGINLAKADLMGLSRILRS